MLHVLRDTWALQAGILLLMAGNGMQGTLLGVRGPYEDFSAFVMSWIIAAYFVGFLGGSRLAPVLIRRVGHVRVFAALGSLVSACLILFAAFPDPYAWFALRAVIGFCFSGVYVVAESWLNDSSTNETRGKVLSVYIIVQMAGIVGAQALVNLGDPQDYFLFVIASVLVSVSFAPILLSASPVPVFETASPMPLRKLVSVSPLGAVGAFCLGGLFSAMWGMGAVYGTQAGFDLGQISTFVATIYVGGLLCQYPLGWLSDRMDRRKLILIAASISAVASGASMFFSQQFALVLVVAFVMGGISNPLYSLIIAYTNDKLEPQDMASGAGGLIFINGVGAVGGPVLVGWLLATAGAAGFFMFIALVSGFLALFALQRMFVQPSPAVEASAVFTPLSQGSTPVAVDMAQEHAIEQLDAD